MTNGNNSEQRSLEAEEPTSPFPLLAAERQQITAVHMQTVLQLWAMAGYSAAAKIWQLEFSAPLFTLLLVLVLLVPNVSFALEAIRDKRLPARAGGNPRHDHISGFGAILLVSCILVISVLAYWAHTNPDASREIYAGWGLGIVLLLSLFFAAVAILPGLNFGSAIKVVGERASRAVKPLGDAISGVDSILVFCVAPSAGATFASRRWRYGFLVLFSAPLGLLGYWLPAPWGLVPIIWALSSAIAISRRWAWVEDDRETAMLNARFRGEHLKIGFQQDLRDEALLAFIPMFILLPLGLRQAHEWGEALKWTMFSIKGVNQDNLLNWIQFFGSELAKAVPFVDWAEIYDVKGKGPIEIGEGEARHVVFAARVLVDLVFLAALLQALDTFARNAKQIEMFEDGVLDRLDPFIERREFRRLVKRDSYRYIKSSAFDRFGLNTKYNLSRLIELKDDAEDPAVRHAAKLLFDRDFQNADIVVELHDKLKELANVPRGKAPDSAAMLEVLSAIEATGPLRLLDELEEVRRRLVAYSSAREVRRKIVEMFVEWGDRPNDEDYALWVSALVAVLIGEKSREAIFAVRRMAFEALKSAYLRTEREVVLAFQNAANSDGAPNLKNEIGKWLTQNPRDIPPPEDSSAPTV